MLAVLERLAEDEFEVTRPSWRSYHNRPPGDPIACKVCVPAGYALSSTQELMALNHRVVVKLSRCSRIVFHDPYSEKFFRGSFPKIRPNRGE